MRYSVGLLGALCVLALGTATALADDAVPPVIWVKVQIQSEGATLATPEVAAQVDNPGVVEMDRSYRLIITPQTRGKDRVQLDMQLFLPTDNNWRLAGEPKITAQFNHAGSIEVRGGDGQSYRLLLTPMRELPPAGSDTRTVEAALF